MRVAVLLTTPIDAAIILIYRSAYRGDKIMMYAGGSFTGLGLTAMAGRLVFDAIELCLNAVQRKANGRAPRFRIHLDWQSDLSALREALSERDYKPGTVDKYVACVSRFLRRVRCTTLRELRHEDVSRYLNELRQSGLANGTLRLHLCALRTVFDRLLDLGITIDIKHAPRPVARRPETRDKVCRLMAACRTKRERLVIDMLNRSKLRPGQLRLLAAPADECLFGKAANADCEKSHLREPVPLEVFTADTRGVSWLLPSPRRLDPLSTRTIRRVVERMSKSCGFRTTCTALRKAEAIPWQAVA